MIFLRNIAWFLQIVFVAAAVLLSSKAYSVRAKETSSAAASQPKLDSTSFEMQQKSLSSAKRQQLYLQLIENFVGWTEHLSKFVESDEQEPSGGYFEARGAGVTWARGNSNLCIAYALLLSEKPNRETFSIYKIPRKQLEDHLRRSIRTVCLSNRNCSRHKKSSHSWGGPSWQSALGMIGTTWAAHLYGEHLDDDTLALVREVSCKEADTFDKKIPSNRFRNTGAEDCCWNTAFLAIVVNKYSQHPKATHWDMRCKQWAINAISPPADASSDKQIDGKPLSEWNVSENVHPDLTLENHRMWSVGYQCTQQHFGEAALAYRVFEKPTPEAHAHHAREMWENVTSRLFLNDGDILNPNGQDWSWKTFGTLEYLCWLNCCLEIPSAGAYESRAIQMIYKRQLAIGTGDLGAQFAKALNFGNQTASLKRWAFCYLMHKHFEQPTPIELPQAKKQSHGMHLYPYMKVALHRTPEKLVSVSWHREKHPIYIFPQDNSTFADPPFFFPYDKNSGIATVKVVANTKKPKRIRSPKLVLVNASELPAGDGMIVQFQKKWSRTLTQHFAVISLSEGATVLVTAFEALNDVTAEVGKQFSFQTDAPPGFKKPVQMVQAERSLNMSDHVQFHSISRLPPSLPDGKFYASQKTKHTAKRGEWFAPQAIAVYTGNQTKPQGIEVHEKTKQPPFSTGKEQLTIQTLTGPRTIDIDFTAEPKRSR